MTNIPFSIYITLPSSIFILIVGLIVWLRNKGKQQLLFFFLTLGQFLWAFGTYVFYQGNIFGTVTDNILLGKLLTLSVFLIPVFIYNFAIEFCRINLRWQKYILFFSYLFAIFCVFFIDTATIINGIFFYQWGEFSIIHYLFSFFALIMLLLSIYNLFVLWKSKSEQAIISKDKRTIILLGISILGILLMDFLPLYGISFYPIFYLTIPIYVLIISHVLSEKNPFDSIATTDILSAIVLTLLATLIIFPELGVGEIQKLISFIVISVFAFFVIERSNYLKEERSVCEKQVLERTKELECERINLNEARKSLEKTNVILENKVKERTRELNEMNRNLERMVDDRAKELKNKTVELEQKVKDLQEFGDIFVNRENKMVELKEKIKELENKLKEK